MSFLSVLKSIGHGIQVGVSDASAFSGIIGSIPVVGAPIDLALNAITAVEKLVPASGNGAAKKTAVTALVNAATPGIDPTTLSNAIDAIVAALNALEAATSKLPTTAPAPA
jgi:hypothetical protein